MKSAFLEKFNKYIKSLDVYRDDANWFYLIINSLNQYNDKNKTVKGIKKENEIIYGENMIKIDEKTSAANTKTKIIEQYLKQTIS